MALGVNTNVGAMVALQNLSKTNRELEVTQGRINTGLAVAGRCDDIVPILSAEGDHGLGHEYDRRVSGGGICAPLNSTGTPPSG